MNNKTNKEKTLILLAIFGFLFVLLCISGCSTSCMGFSCGCESSEDEYNLGGCSYASDGCGTDDFSAITWGCANVGEEQENDDNEYYDDDEENNNEATFTDMMLINCGNYESSFVRGTDGCYSGCMIGKGDDCGDCLGMVGVMEEDSSEEYSIGCVDGCFGCGYSEDSWSLTYYIIYRWLGLGGY